MKCLKYFTKICWAILDAFFKVMNRICKAIKLIFYINCNVYSEILMLSNFLVNFLVPC